MGPFHAEGESNTAPKRPFFCLGPDLGVPKKPTANFDDIGSGLKNFDASLSLGEIK